MSNTPLRGVAGAYRHIIDDVVTRVRTDFVQEGVDEAVLDELRELWESKLEDSGAIAAPPAPVQQPGPAPQYFQPAHAPAYHPAAPAAPALNLSTFGKPEQFLQPTGFQHRPAVQQPLQQPVASAYTAVAAASPGQTVGVGAGGYHAAAASPAGTVPAAAAPGAYAAQLQARHLAAATAPGGYALPGAAGAQQVRLPQQQYLPPQQPQHAQQQFAPQMAAAPVQPVQQQYSAAAIQQQQQYVAAVRPPAQPQQPAQQPQFQQQQQQQQQLVLQPATGALDTRKRPFEGPDQGGPLSKQQYQQVNGAAANPATAAAATIPQRDGNDDDEADPAGGAGGDDAFAGSDEGEDPLAGLSSDEDADGEDIANVVLAQFEKVSRTKTRVGTKWKCQLKNGIMHLNGRDIIFHKGNGEMQF